MPKCPKCGKEINHLIYYGYELQKANVYRVFSIKKKENGEVEEIPCNSIEYSNWDSLGCTKGDPDYECPECDETLFHSEEEAKKFLLGKTEQVKVEGV